MWHHTNYLSPRSGLYLFLAFVFLLAMSGQKTLSLPEKYKFADSGINGVPFGLIPKGKFYKHKPTATFIYQYDNLPLGQRTPLLIVHGLRAEYYPTFRWRKLINHLIITKEFTSKYKIYLARWDTLAPLDKTVPQMQERIGQLYELAGKKQIIVLALSIGGNLVYESMLKPQTDSQIKLLLAMGTPFHGSPLFCADWLQYGIYKNHSLFLTRIDHAIAYRLYFERNPNLLKDFRWDNCDKAIPTIGHFASRLPLGPKGNLLPDNSVNQRMVAINQRNFDKSKLITYSGYLLNPYQLPEAARIIETTFLAPYTLFTIVLPAYFAREHAVLKMLNRIIATVITTDQTAKRSKTNFVYALNDGITPLMSSMFLPDRNCMQDELAREADLTKLKVLTDVHTTRVFRNIDHLTFLDGKRPAVMSGTIRDELNPNAGSRDIFKWILLDLDCAINDDMSKQARDT